MADRGFTIADMLGSYAKYQKLMNSLHRGKLLTLERIHVERAIGRIKCFKLLSDLPNSMARAANPISLYHAF